MFYELSRNDHGLPFSPLKALVVPRPIGWISTLSRDGHVNLAPYSEFNYVGDDPPYLMFSASGHLTGGRKDSCINVEETGEFVYNMATWELREAVKLTADLEERDVDEMELAGLAREPSRLVKPPRVAASPVQLECVHYQTTVLPGRTPKTTSHMVVGKVIGVHIKDEFITDAGLIDIPKIRPLARLGYLDYTAVDASFGIGHKGRDATQRERRIMASKAPQS